MTDFCARKHNVKFERIDEAEEVLMALVHIKIGLIKQFVKPYETSEAFEMIFPWLLDAKVKAGKRESTKNHKRNGFTSK